MKKLSVSLVLLFLVLGVYAQSDHEKTYRSINEALTDSIKVKKLTLSGDSLNQFTPEILKLKNLEEIAFESSDSFDINQAIKILGKLKGLKKLWISDIKNVDIKSISELKNLEELDLDNVGITVLPFELTYLTNLREINLEKNPQINLVQAFNVLSKIKTLKSLWLGENKLSNLPKEISKLKNLEDLWLDGNEFSEIPFSVKSLKIKYISFFDNKLERLNLKRGDLTNLNHINLCYNNFKVFPAVSLSLLPKLDTIRMWYAKVRFIPKEIERLKNLKYLNLEHNFLAKLPSQMAKLKKLSDLELTGNELTTDGIMCIYQLKNLTKLELYENKIKIISHDIKNLKALTEFSVCENPLIEIPGSMRQLKKLQTIQLGYYEKFDWPGAISILRQLPNLKYVGLFKMNLSKMPNGFEKLTTVKEFWMNGNIFDDQEKERIKNILPNAKFSFN